MKAIGQERDEVAEHMACARKTVKQQQLRGTRRTCLPMEDVEAGHVAAIMIGAPSLDGKPLGTARFYGVNDPRQGTGAAVGY